jgi:hypothetical protein
MKGIWAIVAEYKGVAILERPGDVLKVYRDHRYTDGKTYLWEKDKDNKDRLGVLMFELERAVKDYLDLLSNTDTLYSWEEAWQLFIRNNPAKATPLYEEQVARRAGLTYRWDERVGQFVLCPETRDGQHHTHL